MGVSEMERSEYGGKEKEEVLTIVILKLELHCDNCTLMIRRCVGRFKGVWGVTVNMAAQELKVLGNADPSMLRDHVEATTHQKVEIIYIKEQNISKELASIVVLKIGLNCHGCSERIKKTIFKVKGVYEVSVDNQNDLVTVKGTMDMILLLKKLKDKLKCSVEIVSPNIGGGDMKEKAKDEKKDKEEASGNGGDGGGEEKKEGGGGGENGEVAKVGVVEAILVCVVLYFVFVIIFSSR